MEDRDIIIRKALLLTNAAYVLADVINTYMMDVDDELRKIQTEVKRNEKKNLKQALECIRQAQKATKRFTEPLYQVDDVDGACADSDFLSEYIKLLVDRATDENKDVIFRALEERPSHLNIYDKMRKPW